MAVVGVHHYAFDAAKLLNTCVQNLFDVIRLDTSNDQSTLHGLKLTLMETERLLLDFFLHLLKTEFRHFYPTSIINDEKKPKPSLAETMKALKSSMEEKNRVIMRNSKQRSNKIGSPSTLGRTSQKYCYDTSGGARSATDTLLFRLIVALQLCLVRIDDARFVITGCRLRDFESSKAQEVQTVHENRVLHSLQYIAVTGFCSTVLSPAFSLGKRNVSIHSFTIFRPIFISSVKVAFLLSVGRRLYKNFNTVWMKKKLLDSTDAIKEWHQQWITLQASSRIQKEGESKNIIESKKPSFDAINAYKSKLLIDFALRKSPQSSFWYSQGELRFLMLKKAMDVFYAVQPASWHIPPESFYKLTSTTNNQDSLENIPKSLSDLIQKSWSMVSMPAMKNLSLSASRFLKGAAVADRIKVAGVSCFVLSRQPCPELAVEIEKFHRKKKNRRTVKQLATIREGEEHLLSGSDAPKTFAISSEGPDRCRQRDVILHLTGGGFFAHMITFDLPYLVDWSDSTGAVVICPEYALLPEHTFPYALNQVTDVFCALKCGDTVHQLGFETGRIVVTGESTGANLAAALCVKLCMDADGHSEPEEDCKSDKSLAGSSYESQKIEWPRTHLQRSTLCLPDALMLSCAVLDLSLELSHSRVVGTEDPVLPSGVFSTISDAYLPAELGIKKTNILASPLYTPDNILCRFPPTLLFASSTEPLLDDSVAFNQRLRRLGIESELRAVDNLPHAYWGLGVAGFPEALRVQQECREWLVDHITKA